MLVATCPRCGVSVTARLCDPGRIRCRHCGYDGPPPDDVARELYAGHQLLSAHAAHAHQVSRWLQNQLSSEARHRMDGLIAGLVCVAVVVGYLATPVFVIARGDKATAGWVIALGVLSTVLLFGVAALLRRRLLAHLADALTATPPEVPGEPASCRLCGANLVSGTTLIVRCRYCHSDNIVRADVLARAHPVVRAGVNEHFRRFEHARRLAGVGYAILAPVLVLVVLTTPIAATYLSYRVGREKRLNTRVYVRHTQDGITCISAVSFDRLPNGQPARDLTRVQIKSLVGTEISGPDGEVWKIKEVMSDGAILLSQNARTYKISGQSHYGLEQACIAEGRARPIELGTIYDGGAWQIALTSSYAAVLHGGDRKKPKLTLFPREPGAERSVQLPPGVLGYSELIGVGSRLYLVGQEALIEVELASATGRHVLDLPPDAQGLAVANADFDALARGELVFYRRRTDKSGTSYIERVDGETPKLTTLATFKEYISNLVYSKGSLTSEHVVRGGHGATLYFQMPSSGGTPQPIPDPKVTSGKRHETSGVVLAAFGDDRLTRPSRSDAIEGLYWERESTGERRVVAPVLNVSGDATIDLGVATLDAHSIAWVSRAAGARHVVILPR